MENNSQINPIEEENMTAENGSKLVGRKGERAFEKAAEALHKKHKELNKTFSLSFLLTIACVILAALALRQFIAEPTRVKGDSMQYTLLHKEGLLVEKVSYWFGAPERGDIVIVKYPNSADRYVKRIIALPGETVEIRGGVVYVNGSALDEPYVKGKCDWDCAPRTVPAAKPVAKPSRPAQQPAGGTRSSRAPQQRHASGHTASRPRTGTGQPVRRVNRRKHHP